MKTKEIIERIIAIGIMMLIAWTGFGSVPEIYYLESFYPKTFTVQEAFYAALIKWIKFLFTAVPLIVMWVMLKSFLKK